jgi:hypothetical protein
VARTPKVVVGQWWELKEMDRKRLIVNPELQPEFPQMVQGVDIGTNRT